MWALAVVPRERLQKQDQCLGEGALAVWSQANTPTTSTHCYPGTPKVRAGKQRYIRMGLLWSSCIFFKDLMFSFKADLSNYVHDVVACYKNILCWVKEQWMTRVFPANVNSSQSRTLCLRSLLTNNKPFLHGVSPDLGPSHISLPPFHSFLCSQDVYFF